MLDRLREYVPKVIETFGAAAFRLSALTGVCALCSALNGTPGHHEADQRTLWCNRVY
jgi:hypothetical protein